MIMMISMRRDHGSAHNFLIGKTRTNALESQMIVDDFLFFFFFCMCVTHVFV